MSCVIIHHNMLNIITTTTFYHSWQVLDRFHHKMTNTGQPDNPTCSLYPARASSNAKILCKRIHRHPIRRSTDVQLILSKSPRPCYSYWPCRKRGPITLIMRDRHRRRLSDCERIRPRSRERSPGRDPLQRERPSLYARAKKESNPIWSKWSANWAGRAAGESKNPPDQGPGHVSKLVRTWGATWYCCGTDHGLVVPLSSSATSAENLYTVLPLFRAKARVIRRRSHYRNEFAHDLERFEIHSCWGDWTGNEDGMLGLRNCLPWKRNELGALKQVEIGREWTRVARC